MNVFSYLNPVKVRNTSNILLGAGIAFLIFAFTIVIFKEEAVIAILLLMFTTSNMMLLWVYPSPAVFTSFAVLFVLFIPTGWVLGHPLQLMNIGFLLLCGAMFL